MSALTDREILELCARAYGRRVLSFERGSLMLMTANPMLSEPWNPLADDGDAARMENKCGLDVDCHAGMVVCVLPGTKLDGLVEHFTPGNDAERRRASCMVVARMQQKEGSGS